MTVFFGAAAMARSGVPFKEIERELLTKKSESGGESTKYAELALDFSRRTGAPIADLLNALGLYFAQIQRRESELTTAMATPRATARVMLALPLVALFSTELMGLGSISVFMTAPGLAVFALAALLAWLGQVWSKRILRMEELFPPSGLLTMLNIAGLKSGLELELVRYEAWRQVEQGAGMHIEGEQQQIDSAVKSATVTGAPVSAVLEALLARLQHESAEKSMRAVRDRAVRLMLPLGLTGLPSFMLVSVAPMLLNWLSLS